MWLCVQQASFSQNWCQLYVDMRYLIEQDEKLYRIKELTRNTLETRLNMKYRIVYKLINHQLSEFRENEKNPSWDIIIEKLLPYILKEIIHPLEKIRGEEASFPLYVVLFGLLVQQLCDK